MLIDGVRSIAGILADIHHLVLLTQDGETDEDAKGHGYSRSADFMID